MKWFMLPRNQEASEHVSEAFIKQIITINLGLGYLGAGADVSKGDKCANSYSVQSFA